MTPIEETLLAIVRELDAEIHPKNAIGRSVTLDSSLTNEIGLDSLSRVELLARVEKRFGVMIPERTFNDVETIRDLLRALLAACPPETAVKSPAGHVLMPDSSQEIPTDAKTLTEVLSRHVAIHPQKSHIYFYRDDGRDWDSLSYSQLRTGAETVAFHLQSHGLSPGKTVAIMLPTEPQFFFSFIGILLAGGIPVPLYPPVRRSQLEDHLLRQTAILKNCGATVMIVMPEAKRFAQMLRTQVDTLRTLITTEDLSSKTGPINEVKLKSSDIAFLQYTSGSTGNPKGVMISHANVLANLRAMGRVVQINPEDVIVSWLPLYHDMGLIGTWMSSLYYACPLVLMSPFSFLTRPERWLWAIHQHRGTISAAPNFAYELCLKRIQEADLAGLDLRSWRIACNGAEPVSPVTLEQFCKRFELYGFRRETLMPVYGLAESTVGLCFPPMNRGPVIDRIQRDTFMRHGQAVTAEAEDPHPLEFVACGRPLPAHEVRIVDATGRETPDRQEGNLQFRGPSSTSGYFHNHEDSKKLFRGDWLDSGDYAYLAEGDVYITGRKKDIIIRAGRNIYPQELEEAVSGLSGIRKGNVVVFGSMEPASSTEQLVVVAETREEDASLRDALKGKINRLAIDLTGMQADRIILAKPGTVLKTSSGKIRRAANRQLYESGQIGKRPHNAWWSFLRMLSSSMLPSVRRLRRFAGEYAYAAYSITAYLVLAPFTWLSVTLLPRYSWRWHVMRNAVRLLARITGTPMIVKGLENVKQGKPCIYVANHASYLDGYVMAAVLPPGFSFVAKQELSKNAILRIPLNRIRTEYVTRSNKEKSVEDARRLSQVAVSGRSLFFFPEGTFSRRPGLRPFHMGAFLAAAEANIPVVPVAIRGTRPMLLDTSFFPRRGLITVSIGKPIDPSKITGGTLSDLWTVALTMRDLAREHILLHCGEPDLVEKKYGS